MTPEEHIAHEIALELAEATWADRKAWKWPDDFVGDVIDRARSAASRVVVIARLEALEEAAKIIDGQCASYENGDLVNDKYENLSAKQVMEMNAAAIRERMVQANTSADDGSEKSGEER